jgi:molybdate transport system substrate-binding protein
VASNFSPIVNKIIPEFTKQTHIKVDVISGASGALFQQIRHGAPYDVFLSADSVRPANLKKENFIVPNSLHTYAMGKLAFWSATRPINTNQLLSDILVNYKKIAISNPTTAPYGKSAMEVLIHLGLENTFTKSNLITGMNVNQTFQQVRSKSVEGGFVALSQLTLNQLIGLEIPEQYYTPIKQQLVILKRSNFKEEAKLFTQFILNPKVQQKIASFGYTAIMPTKIYN